MTKHSTTQLGWENRPMSILDRGITHHQINQPTSSDTQTVAIAPSDAPIKRKRLTELVYKIKNRNYGYYRGIALIFERFGVKKFPSPEDHGSEEDISRYLRISFSTEIQLEALYRKFHSDYTLTQDRMLASKMSVNMMIYMESKESIKSLEDRLELLGVETISGQYTTKHQSALEEYYNQIATLEVKKAATKEEVIIAEEKQAQIRADSSEQALERLASTFEEFELRLSQESPERSDEILSVIKRFRKRHNI